MIQTIRTLAIGAVITVPIFVSVIGENRKLKDEIGKQEKAVQTLQENLRQSASMFNDFAETVSTLQIEQATVSGKLDRTIINIGKLSNESKNFIDQPLPDDVIRLLKQTDY